jgi:hypothetical protein
MKRTCFHGVAVLSAALLIVGCGSQNSQDEQRLAELEKKLAETQKQLADAASQAQPSAAPVEQPPPPAPASAPAATQTQPAASKPAATPPKPTSPPASQKPAADAATRQANEQVQRELDQQKAVNQKQAEANVRLQQEVAALQPREYTLPVGTVIPVRTRAELSTSKVSNGSVFEALLENDVKSGEAVIAKAGSRVTGVVVTSDPGGRVKGVASLTVGVRSLTGVKGEQIAISTDSYTATADSTKKKDAVRTGIATGVGAIIGGIAGGGSGAAIGAGAGAATGVGVNAATRGAAAVIPAEELMEFTLAAPVKVVVRP